MAGFAFAFAMFLWLTAPPWLHGGFFCLVQCHSISIYFHNSSSLTTHIGGFAPTKPRIMSYRGAIIFFRAESLGREAQV